MVRSRPLLILCALLLLALVVQTCRHIRPAPPGSLTPVTQPRRVSPVRAGPLVVPVAGVPPDRLVDTFTQARAEGERRHDAIDILAPRGTPVIAAAAGTVEKLFHSDLGGNTIYIRSADRRWSHYYAHLDGYRPGLAEGQTVTAGTVIGTVGSTGNADPAAPHLHFAVHRMQPDEGWDGGVAINPYPLLARRH